MCLWNNFFWNCLWFGIDFLVVIFSLFRPSLVRLPKREAPSVSAAQGPVPHWHLTGSTSVPHWPSYLTRSSPRFQIPYRITWALWPQSHQGPIPLLTWPWHLTVAQSYIGQREITKNSKKSLVPKLQQKQWPLKLWFILRVIKQKLRRQGRLLCTTRASNRLTRLN